MNSLFSRLGVTLLIITGSLAMAVTVPADKDSIRAREIQIHKPEVLISPIADFRDHREGKSWDDPAWKTFLVRYGKLWDLSIDHRSGRPDLIQGQGIPWVPGDGNGLGAEALQAIGVTPGIGLIPRGIIEKKNGKDGVCSLIPFGYTMNRIGISRLIREYTVRVTEKDRLNIGWILPEEIN